MTIIQDAEAYVENRVEEIEGQLSQWFGMEEYSEDVPDVEISDSYRTAAYDDENDLIGVSTGYLRDKTFTELDMSLAEECAHRIYGKLHPEDESFNRSEFFGRLSYLLFAEAYEEDVDEMSLEDVEGVLREKKKAEKEAEKRDQERRQRHEERMEDVPGSERFNKSIEAVKVLIGNRNYGKAKSGLRVLADEADEIDEGIAETLRDQADKLEDMEGAEDETLMEYHWLDFASEMYEIRYNMAKDMAEDLASSDISTGLVKVGTEDIRQHLTYAFADRYFEDIFEMDSDERAELIRSPDKLVSELMEGDEEMMEFIEDNSELLQQNINI